MASRCPYTYRASHDEPRHGAGTASATNSGGRPPRSALGTIRRSGRPWRCWWAGTGVGDRSTGDPDRVCRVGAVQRRWSRPLHRRVTTARRFALIAAFIHLPSNRRQRGHPAFGAVVVQRQCATSCRRLGRGHRPPRYRGCAVARPGPLDDRPASPAPRCWRRRKVDPPAIDGIRGRHSDETGRAPRDRHSDCLQSARQR